MTPVLIAISRMAWIRPRDTASLPSCGIPKFSHGIEPRDVLRASEGRGTERLWGWLGSQWRQRFPGYPPASTTEALGRQVMLWP